MRKVPNETRMNRKRRSSPLCLQKRESFITTMTSIFSIGRCFGVPMNGGVLAISWALVLLCLLVTIVVTAVWKVIKVLGGLATYTTGGRSLVARLSGTIFYANALLSLVLSWRLVSSWQGICLFWARADVVTGVYFPADTKIRRRTIIVAGFVASCALVEHLLSMVSAIGVDCSLSECFENYILNSHGFILKPEDYCLELAIPIFVVSKMATALWNFQDLIIILISMGLTSRYHSLNLFAKQLVKTQKSEMDAEKFEPEVYKTMTWRKLREAYVRQAALVRKVDNELGALILLSNFNNFYFICLQLFLGINQESGPLFQRLYYFLSLSWLMFRACSVVLAAADVNIHSQSALPYLYDCSQRDYNVEIKRLENQLTYDNVALKGMGFFSLKRQMLLEVAAAIIKYELVLLQYDN